MTGDVGTNHSMCVGIGAADQDAVQMCKSNRSLRVTTFTSTIGPLSLIQSGASLARLAGKQAHLLHSVNSRVTVLSVAVPQPSAGAVGVHIPEYPIPPVQLNGECSRASSSDNRFCYRRNNDNVSNVPQFSSTAIPDDCIAKDLYCGELNGMGDYDKARVRSGGARTFCCKSRILKG